jgi:Putative peptidoglycan binding domain
MGKSRLDPQTTAKLRNWGGKRDNSAQANEEHREHKLHHHDRDWWRHHCVAIVFFDWGYWGWEDGWWFPAWGYDPYYSYYAYDGPIYGYNGLPPDQVVADVQGALQRLGYYQGAIDGVLGPATQEAIERYQRDHGLPVTGGIDARTLASMGFTQ